MRKLLLIIPAFFIILTITRVCAKLSHQDAVEFFYKYVQNANNYSDELPDMYLPDAKIIRGVITPTGEVEEVIIPSKRFFRELKIGQKTAKLRKYKNSYRNIKAENAQNGIKISAERQPSHETYWLKMYQILQPADDGYKIKEEMMQTKVQSFLRHKNKGE